MDLTKADLTLWSAPELRAFVLAQQIVVRDTRAKLMGEFDRSREELKVALAVATSAIEAYETRTSEVDVSMTQATELLETLMAQILFVPFSVLMPYHEWYNMMFEGLGLFFQQAATETKALGQRMDAAIKDLREKRLAQEVVMANHEPAIAAATAVLELVNFARERLQKLTR